MPEYGKTSSYMFSHVGLPIFHFLFSIPFIFLNIPCLCLRAEKSNYNSQECFPFFLFFSIPCLCQVVPLLLRNQQGLGSVVQDPFTPSLPDNNDDDDDDENYLTLKSNLSNISLALLRSSLLLLIKLSSSFTIDVVPSPAPAEIIFPVPSICKKIIVVQSKNNIFLISRKTFWLPSY